MIKPEKSIEEKGEVFMFFLSSAFYITSTYLLTIILKNIYLAGNGVLVLYYFSYSLIGWAHPGRAKQKDIIHDYAKLQALKKELGVDSFLGN